MPPRYAYWTILIDGKATAFRTKEREELLPTFTQLARTNTDITMKFFARGKLWDTPEQAHWASKRLSPARDRRGKDWRPGGTHEDPRKRFDKPKDERGDKAKSREKSAARPPRDSRDTRAPWKRYERDMPEQPPSNRGPIADTERFRDMPPPPAGSGRLIKNPAPPPAAPPDDPAGDDTRPYRELPRHDNRERPKGYQRPRDTGDRPARKPFNDNRGEWRPPQGGDRPPRKPFGESRGPAKPYGDRPSGPRKPFSDRPKGPWKPRHDGDRPARKPFNDNRGEWRPPQSGDRPPRKPYGESSGPAKPYGDRPRGPRKPFSDRPKGPWKPRDDRPRSDRPKKPR